MWELGKVEGLSYFKMLTFDITLLFYYIYILLYFFFIKNLGTFSFMPKLINISESNLMQFDHKHSYNFKVNWS